MLATYTYPKFAYRPAPELGLATPARRPVVVVGAGPVGLAFAIDLAQRGQSVLVLDEDDTVSVGSRGLCWAQRSLQILDRLGCGQVIVDKGVTWNIGRTFAGAQEVYRFDLQPEAGHERPGMVNLQQYHLEEALVRRAAELPGLELRWRHRLSAVQRAPDGVLITVETDDGPYRLQVDWLLAADGARSPLRHLLGLEMQGRVFNDRFLIADVVLEQPLFAPDQAERWFWFDPPFHPGRSVLLHREADQVWRIDFQLGPEADPELERQPERVRARIQAMLGPQTRFELEWVSVYTFQCRRMSRFHQQRVLFIGDAAHQVSPFGARGANSGLQDADNLAWKLDAVLRGRAPPQLLDSYDSERGQAADENLLNSTRATDFISPKSPVSQLFRDAVLGLAREHGFARRLVNSGRLSVPCHLRDSPLSTHDDSAAEPSWSGAGGRPGSPLPDAPLRRDGQAIWLLRVLGPDFNLLVFEDPERPVPACALTAASDPDLHWVRLASPEQACGPTVFVDVDGCLARRLGAWPGSVYLIRPDQHVAARWRQFDAAAVRAALDRALARSAEDGHTLAAPRSVTRQVS